MKQIIIQDSILQRFQSLLHFNIYIYLLLKCDDNGVYRNGLDDIANYCDITTGDVNSILERHLPVKFVSDGVLVTDYASYVPKDKEPEEETLVLTPEREKNERKTREVVTTAELKFQESMRLFYPNVAEMKTPLSLTEYNILLRFVAENLKLPILNANELIIDVLQQLDQSQNIKKKVDAYKTVRNWIGMITRNKTFSVEYYRNINITARKNERESIKKARLNQLRE